MELDDKNIKILLYFDTECVIFRILKLKYFESILL